MQKSCEKMQNNISKTYQNTCKYRAVMLDRRGITDIVLKKNKHSMYHIGNLLKKAVDESGFTINQLAKELNVSNSTLFRWFEIPNLPIKKIVDVNRAVPLINLKEVYEAIEAKLGYQIPENPYRKGNNRTKDTDPGIKISIDSNKYAGYSIPPDLLERVQEYIETYNAGRDKADN